MKLDCYKCGYSWNYGGKSKHYVTCPTCMTKLSLNKIRRLKEETEK
jgi:hypothetical protein